MGIFNCSTGAIVDKSGAEALLKGAGLKSDPDPVNHFKNEMKTNVLLYPAPFNNSVKISFENISCINSATVFDQC